MFRKPTKFLHGGQKKNITSKEKRDKAQRSFEPVKVQRKMHNLSFLISEAQPSFLNELAERYFRTKLKRKLTSAITISQHNANTAFFEILNKKRVNNLLKKADSNQYYDRNGTKLKIKVQRNFRN